MAHFFHVLKQNGRIIFLFELLFRVFSIGVFLPLLQYIFSKTLKWFHYSYITPNNILRYLSDMRVLLLLGILALLILIGMLFEICCLFACFRSCDRGRKITLTEMIWMGFRKTDHLLKRYHIGILFALLFLFPVMNLHLLFEWNQPILSYLVELIYTTYGNKWIFASGIVIIWFFGVFSCYFVPAAILEKDAEVHVSRTWRECKKELPLGMLKILLFNVLVLLFLILLYLIVSAIGIIGIKLFWDDDVVFVTALEYSDNLWYVMFCVSGLITTLFNSVLMYCIHANRKDGQSLLYNDVPMEFSISKTVQKRIQILFGMGYLIAAIVCLRTFYHGSYLLHEVMNPISVTAHRGGASTGPENTLEALQQAINYTADYAEIDVQETQDGVVVLLHDLNLKRTTGYNAYVYDMTYDKVRQLDAGSYFSEEYAGAFVPTLLEALQLCKGKINLNIEIKSNSHYSDDLPEKVVTLIEENEFIEQCVVTSMNYSYLKRIKELNPSIRTGYILKMSVGNIASLEYADFFSMKYSYVTENIVTQIHQEGKEVHVWTVNTSSGIHQMKVLNVDNIITDNIPLVRKILSREDGKESWSELFYLFLNRE
ncbi:MAG: glycerophosphodiester phosphodiesterase family protein [Lachnospiraceae bacterium]